MSGASARSSSRNSSPRGLRGARTRIPASSARASTAVGSMPRPRPLGRGGWVTTATTSCALPRIASRMVTANSGLPQKTTRRPLPLPRRFLGGGFVPQPLPLADDHLALERAEMIDEEDSFEMVDLVLEDARKEIPALHLLRLAAAAGRSRLRGRNSARLHSRH